MLTAQPAAGKLTALRGAGWPNLAATFRALLLKFRRTRTTGSFHRQMVVTRLSEYRRNLEDIQNERDMLRNQVNEVNASLKGLNLGFEHHCTHSANEFRHRIQQLEQRLAQLDQQQGAAVPPQAFQVQPPYRPSAPSNFESIGFSNQMGRLLSSCLCTLLPNTWPPLRSKIRELSHNLANEKRAFPRPEVRPVSVVSGVGLVWCLPRCRMAPTEASMASMAQPGMSGSNDEVITRPDGQFRWLLKEYSRTKRHQRHGTHRYTSSPIFCTGVPGYRLQLRLHLNGMGQSRKGRFMAVQLVLLRGPNDSELSWPFRHRVTVTLVNQNGPQHVSYTINDPSFPRPQGEHTVPYVWQEFVAFSDLEANPGLAWNDCLLFEVTVTPPSPPPPGMYPPL
ncbi:hypothetical protein MTO96_017557 [Rhipicephalus appendiculatus]